MYLSENRINGNQLYFFNAAPTCHEITADEGPVEKSSPKTKTEFLSPIDERSLVRQWQKRKDHRARDALVRAFQPAIAKVARKYSGRGLDLDDGFNSATSDSYRARQVRHQARGAPVDLRASVGAGADHGSGREKPVDSLTGHESGAGRPKSVRRIRH